jgi:hypothetical protein
VVWASRSPTRGASGPESKANSGTPAIAAPNPSASAPSADVETDSGVEARNPTANSTVVQPPDVARLEPTSEAPSKPPAPDVATLAEDECWLLVEAHLDAAVFVHGIDLGRTNQWLRSRCGFRFIRLGAAPGQWLSEGTPHRLPCRQAVTIEIEPSEPFGP